MGANFEPCAAVYDDHDTAAAAFVNPPSCEYPPAAPPALFPFDVDITALIPLLRDPAVLATAVGVFLSYLYLSGRFLRILVAIITWINPPRFPRPPATHADTGAMSRLLGLSAPPSAQGIMASVTHAAKGLASSLPAMSALASDAPAGLGNINNSCFQNSVLQGLSALESMPAYLDGASVLEEMHKGPEDASETSTAISLKNFVAALRGTHNNGRTLWTPPRLKSLNTWQQQDAQEYFTKILDEVEREMAKAARASIPVRGLEWDVASEASANCSDSDDSGYQSTTPTAAKSAADAVKMFKNPLEGLLAQRVVCTACRHTDGLDMIPFNFLTLNLPTNTYKCFLDECLDAYTRVEDIDGVECAKCTLLKAKHLLSILIQRNVDAGTAPASLDEARARLQAVETALDEEDFDWSTVHDRCKIALKNRVASTKTKHTVIARPPQSLVLHCNRSVFDEFTGNMYKNTAGVGFEPYLNLGRWCIGNASPEQTADSALGSEDADSVLSECNELEERWTTDPHAAMGGDEGGIPLNPTYELKAVITHFGRHENGHYVCYKRTPYSTPQGPEAEDDEVSGHQWWRISDETVIKVSDEEMPFRTEAGTFMLFYDCVGMTELDENISLGGESIAGALPTASAIANPFTPPRDTTSPLPGMQGETQGHAGRPGATPDMMYPLTPESSAAMDSTEIEEQKLDHDPVLPIEIPQPLPTDHDKRAPVMAKKHKGKLASGPQAALQVSSNVMLVDKNDATSIETIRQVSASA